ncbi:MAG TPA: phosphatase PAP2 family protein [Thermoleophilaceae bacterium]|jgi:undecaprenyl-diphosphatase
MLGAVDLAVLRAFRTRGHTRALERGAGLLSLLGEHGALWLGICAAGGLVSRDNRGPYARAAKTVLGTYALNQAIKFVVRRPRPRMEDLPPLAGTVSSLSYPSAHTATSLAGARMLAGLLPGAPLYTLATLTALSRLYLGVHYPSDIVAGAALGSAVAELAS